MPDDTPIWSKLTPEEHEFQYNPQAAFPDFDRYRAKRQPANETALKTLDCHRDVSFGDHPLRTLDIYPAGDGQAPVHVFLHGGYWRAQDKANFAFVAGTLVPLGVTTVIANYELCPKSTLDEVTDSALAAVGWVGRNIGDHGGDPGRITVSGHSAGAHLGAEMLAFDWTGEGLPRDLIAGATLISGIFDPAPARLTSVNAQLNLSDETIARRNVETRPPIVRCPVSLIVGGIEPWQWIDQTYRYSHHLHRNGYQFAVNVLPGRNHFDIMDEYLDPSSVTIRMIMSHIEAAAQPRAGGAS